MIATEPQPEIDEYIHRLGLLHELGQELGRAIDEGIFFRTAAAFIRRILPQIDRASVTLLTPDGAHMELFALDATAPELASTFPVGVRVAIEGTMIGLVLRGQQLLAFEGEAFAQSELADLVMLRGLGLRSSMDAPLITGGTVIGTVNTASSLPTPYGPRDRELLERVASLMAAHLERFRLVDQLRGALDAARRNAAHMEREASVLRSIVEGTAGELGAGFLQSLVRHLAAALGTRWACLSEPVADGTSPPAKARTIAFWDRDHFLPSVTYDLAGAPCAEALGGQICYQPRGVRDRFPNGILVRELGVEAYVGVPLFDADGKAFADLVVMDERPLDEDDEQGGAGWVGSGGRSLRVVQIFAARAQAELLRLRAESERARLLTELRRTTALIETTTDFACLVSLTGEVLYINPAGMQLVGHEGEDPTRLRAGDIVAGERSLSFAAVLEIAREHGSWSGERHFRHRSGRIIPVDQVVTLIRDETGEPICTGSIARDVSEHKRILRELEEARSGAEAANRAKSAFLAKMSHELRTPLGAILGFTQLLGREPGLAPQPQEYLRIIRQSGEHLLALINDTLEMSRIEAGRVTLRPEVFDLHELFSGIVAMLRLRAEEKGLALRTELAPDLPRLIRTDAAKLRQILLNLLGNAIKFTEQGEVILRARAGSAPGDGREVRLHVEVQDTGPGIDAREKGALFDAFYQAEAGRRSHEGTGLGLPISQQFVRLLGGHIDFESELGRGSCFRFDVLVELAADLCGELATPPTRARVVGLAEDQPEVRVLVAEDRWTNRTLLCRLLRATGFTVLEAENGEEAVAQWARHAPDLIWMDMAMPVMDGLEATRRIRTSAPPGARRTVIIALTASAFEEERDAVLAVGCDDFVTKPFEEHQLFEKMALHLGVRYRYEEQATPTVPARGDPTPEQLRALSTALVSALREAALQLDPEQTGAVIEQIRASAPDLADGLCALVRSFDFDRLLQLTEGVGPAGPSSS